MTKTEAQSLAVLALQGRLDAALDDLHRATVAGRIIPRRLDLLPYAAIL